MEEDLIQKIFGEEGLISRHHEHYEYRPGQIEMAEAVAKAFEEKKHLIVEAGTGTGKTLAYLIPAVAAALGNKRRIIISTGTKNLQEQLMKKDIPFLQEILPKKFSAEYMKGRSNYACLYRIAKAENQPILEGLDEMDHFEEVRHWAKETAVGDRSELVNLPENISFWSRINAKSETCIGQKCPEFEPCFITRMRERADGADVIIVNHHLFFADLNVRGNQYGRVIPDYGAVIFDEAHLIEDIAADYFGFQVSSFQIDELARDTDQLPITDSIVTRELTKHAAKILGLSEQFWVRFTQARGQDGRYPLLPEAFNDRNRDGEKEPSPLGDAYFALDGALQRLETAIDAYSEKMPEAESLVRRIRQTRFDLDFIVTQAESNYVYWLEKRGKGMFLRASPIDVSQLLREKLFEKVDTCILTSATLAANGKFDFIQRAAGARKKQNYRFAGAVRLRLREPGADLPSAGDARPALVRIYPDGGRRDREAAPGDGRPRFCAGDKQRLDERAIRACLGAGELPVFCAGIDVEDRDTGALSQYAERGPFCHIELLAGGRRPGRAAFLRDNRQAAIRRAVGSDRGGPDQVYRRERRPLVFRIQHPASGDFSETGRRAPDPEHDR